MISCDACKLNKRRKKPNKPEEHDAVSKVKHRHGNSVASLKCACVKKSIIYNIMHKETAPIYRLSRNITPKPNKFSITDIQEKPVDFLYGIARAPTLFPAIISQT